MTSSIWRTEVYNSNPINGFAFGFLIIFLSIFPWLHGAELLWEQLYFCGAIFAVLLLSIVNWRPRFKTASLIKVVSSCFFIWLIIMMLYLIPLPAQWVEKIAPATYQWQLQHDAKEYLPLSLYPQITLIEVIKYASLGALFFSVYKLCDSLTKVRTLLYLLVMSATLTALYSLLNYATNGSFELVQAIPPWDLGWNEGVRGTFSYKNQYAMYLVMSLSIAIGLLIDYWSTFIKRQSKSSTIITFFTPKIIVLFISSFILIYTLFNTSSRGALASMVLALGCVIGGAILANKHFRNLIFKPKFLAIGAIALCVGLVVLSQTSVFKRFTESQFEDNGRIMLHQTAISVIHEFGPVGTGPGTYPFVQHHFKDKRLGNSAMSKRAHNDYLETIATQGFAGAILLLTILFALIYETLRSTKHRANLLHYGIYAGILAYLIQSSFDVNISTFYLPAFFVLLLAVGNRLASECMQRQPDEGLEGGVGR